MQSPAESRRQTFVIAGTRPSGPHAGLSFFDQERTLSYCTFNLWNSPLPSSFKKQLYHVSCPRVALFLLEGSN